ncbi:MAG: hypothetical protein EGR90_00105 [Lachnospiraceae bacterium]|nr:hypothetical protein [Lachnospiraceae bacterium]
MERLTERIDNVPDGESGVWVKQHDYISAAEKLAVYEDAEEQGLLLRLPCKAGDTLYFTHHDRVISSEVFSVKYHVEAENHGIFIRERLTIDVEGISAEIDFCDIGKTVFLTREEAEAKLKEMERSHE